MEFNKDEQRAILKILDYIIKADDYIEEDEIDYLAKVALENGFDDTILVDLHLFGLNQAIDILGNLNEEKQKFVFKTAKKQAKSDNDFAKSEKEFLKELKKKVK